jgi:pimeloyl-ACP methyl ester carboxylesterase
VAALPPLGAAVRGERRRVLYVLFWRASSLCEKPHRLLRREIFNFDYHGNPYRSFRELSDCAFSRLFRIRGHIHSSRRHAVRRANIHVAFVHGLGEDASAFEAPAAELARAGVRVFALDFGGHGRSEGDRHDGSGWAALLSEARQFIEYTASASSAASTSAASASGVDSNADSNDDEFFASATVDAAAPASDASASAAPASSNGSSEQLPPFLYCVGSSLGAAVLLALRTQPTTRHVCEDGLVRLAPLRTLPPASLPLASSVPPLASLVASIGVNDALVARLLPKAPVLHLSAADLHDASPNADANANGATYRAAFVESVRCGLAQLDAFVGKISAKDAGACPMGFAGAGQVCA